MNTSTSLMTRLVKYLFNPPIRIKRNINNKGTRDPMEQKAIELLNAACGGKINDIKSVCDVLVLSVVFCVIIVDVSLVIQVLIGYGLDLSINLCCMHNQRALPDKLAGAMAFFHYSFGELGSFLSHVMVKELGAFGMLSGVCASVQ